MFVYDLRLSIEFALTSLQNLINCVFAYTMGVENLKASTLPEYPKDISPELWPTRKDSDQTVIRFDWDEDGSDIFNLNNLIAIYVEICARGSRHYPEASPYLSDISQEDFLDRLKQEYEMLRRDIIQFRHHQK